MRDFISAEERMHSLRIFEISETRKRIINDFMWMMLGLTVWVIVIFELTKEVNYVN